MKKSVKKSTSNDAPLTAAELRRLRPARDVFPELVKAHASGNLRKRGRPESSQKSAVSIRLDNNIIAALRASGTGWQTRVNDLLKAVIEVRSH